MILTMALVLLIALVGILLNAYVMRRLYKFARTEPNRFEQGCGLPLMVMAVSDVLTLAGVVVFGLLGNVIIVEFLYDNTNLSDIFCKSRIYWTHVTTNVSVWCWVLMSAMRYMAVYHPLLQLRLWRLPRRGVLLIILLSLLFNITFMGAFQFRDEQCKEAAMFGWQTATWWLNLAEILWGFFIPMLLTLFMDGRVLLADPPAGIARRHVRGLATQSLNAGRLLESNDMETSRRNIAVQHSSPRLRQTILKWLAITSVDLLLNAPDNLLRLAVMFADAERPIWQWYSPVRFVSQLCYFSQFGINAISLSLVVYNHSIEPKRSTMTTALSIMQQSLQIVSSPISAAGMTTSIGSLPLLQAASGCDITDQSDADEGNQALYRIVRTHTM